MATAYASAIIPAPIDKVWQLVRDFNGLPVWHPGIASSEIEDGRSADSVGCVRSFHLKDGAHVREQLVSLDDTHHRLSYNFVKPAFPVTNYLAWIKLSPITSTGETFAEWGRTSTKRRVMLESTRKSSRHMYLPPGGRRWRST